MAKQNTQEDTPALRTVDVVGSTGNHYTVTITADGTRSCTCRGYEYHMHCRHLEMVQ